MRKITREVCTAFYSSRVCTIGNTHVTSTGDNAEMLLHGNLIAKRVGAVVKVNFQGWGTTTTKERLNGVVEYHQNPRVKGFCTRGGDLMACINGELLPVSDIADDEGWVTL